MELRSLIRYWGSIILHCNINSDKRFFMYVCISVFKSSFDQQYCRFEFEIKKKRQSLPHCKWVFCSIRKLFKLLYCIFLSWFLLFSFEINVGVLQKKTCFLKHTRLLCWWSLHFDCLVVCIGFVCFYNGRIYIFGRWWCILQDNAAYLNKISLFTLPHLPISLILGNQVAEKPILCVRSSLLVLPAV